MFTVDHEYSRKLDIHHKFGGQEQGGIVTPALHPVIFVFTGKEGTEFGYEDGWVSADVFTYCGQGQHGDMQFLRGNKAIRDHAENGKDILLFETMGKGMPVKFLGHFDCQSWEIFDGTDVDGKDRKAIKFHLVRNSTVFLPEGENSQPSQSGMNLEELRKRAYSALKPKQVTSWKTIQLTRRERSQAVKEYVLARSCGKCEFTGQPAPFLRKDGTPYLEVHHTRRLSDGGPDHPRWVAAISPNIHREIHSGKNGKAINNKLMTKLSAIEAKS